MTSMYVGSLFVCVDFKNTFLRLLIPVLPILPILPILPMSQGPRIVANGLGEGLGDRSGDLGSTFSKY